MHLSEEEVAGRQAEMDRLRRIWREVCRTQRSLTPAEREAQALRHKAQRDAEREGYHAQLRALLDRQSAPVDLRAKIADAGVQQQHLDALRKGLDERAAFTAARRWWSQPKTPRGLVDVVDRGTGEVRREPRLVRQHPFLVLAGATGLGKSQAAAWCIREAARAYPWNAGATGQDSSRPFVLWHGADMAATSLYGNHSATRMDDAEREWLEADRAVVLALDDLFPSRKPLSGPHQDRLTRLLVARHGRGAATVLTANADTPTLADLLDGQGSRMGGPLYRRLLQSGHMVELHQRGQPTVLVGGRQLAARGEK